MPRAKKQRASKKAARTARRGRGPSPDSKSSQIRSLLEAGMAPMAIAEKVGCTPGLVYQIKSKRSGVARTAGKRGPGRPRKFAAGEGTVADLVAAVRQAEEQRLAMRQALEQMHALVQAALASS